MKNSKKIQQKLNNNLLLVVVCISQCNEMAALKLITSGVTPHSITHLIEERQRLPPLPALVASRDGLAEADHIRRDVRISILCSFHSGQPDRTTEKTGSILPLCSWIVEALS